jgi:hypothetical protein
MTLSFYVLQPALQSPLGQAAMLAAFLTLALRGGLPLTSVAVVVAKAVLPPAAVFCLVRFLRTQYDVLGESSNDDVSDALSYCPQTSVIISARRAAPATATSISSSLVASESDSRELFPFLESLHYDRSMFVTPHATSDFHDGSA